MQESHNATSGSARLAHFVSVTDGEILDESTEGTYIEVDREGAPLIGDDEHGVWWGTEDAAWVLSEVWYSTRVQGYLGSENYTGHFIGTMEEVLFYCVEHGVKVYSVECGDGRLLIEPTLPLHPLRSER